MLHSYADDGEVGLEELRVQVDCWAVSRSSAKAVSRAVRSALSAFTGSIGGVNLRLVTLDDERDFQEQGSDKPEYLYRTSLDFNMWVQGQ